MSVVQKQASGPKCRKHTPKTISADALLFGSRYVRLLSDLNDTPVETAQGSFAERLGQLIDLPGSIVLSTMQAKLSAVTCEPNRTSSESVRNLFLQERKDLVRFIAMSFAPNGGSKRNKIPTLEKIHAHCELNGLYASGRRRKSTIHEVLYEPYRKFYLNRQRDIEIKVRYLRTHVREMVSGISTELAQLATIDSVLDHVLSGKTRALFLTAPRLAGIRFGCLHDEHRKESQGPLSIDDLKQWMTPEGWISTFCKEIQTLLLAELEVRLQPVTGMIESLPETDSRNQPYTIEQKRPKT